jgi:hypothetical protein
MIKAFRIFLFLLFPIGFIEAHPINVGTSSGEKKDSLERQFLYNGRIWENEFGLTEGNQFFLASDFSDGSVAVDVYNFRGVKVKFDLINDQLLIQKDDGTIIQLNKELIHSFSLNLYEKTYNFINFKTGASGNLDGYCQLLYDGNIKIYVKYLKELIPTTITNGLPKFSQINKIYIVKDGRIHRTNNRKDLLNLFAEGEEQGLIKKYIIGNRIMISRNDPESFRRVIEYYETRTK